MRLKDNTRDVEQTTTTAGVRQMNRLVTKPAHFVMFCYVMAQLQLESDKYICPHQPSGQKVTRAGVCKSQCPPPYACP